MSQLPDQVTLDEQLIAACENNNATEVNNLLQNGANVNTVVISGASALHIAAENNNLEILNALLQKGARVDALTDEGWTALHFAALKGYIDIAKVLIQAGADINIPGFLYQRTALHYAADQARSQMVALLLEKGANPDLLDKQGNSALKIAELKNHQEVIKLLAKKDDNKTLPVQKVTTTDNLNWE